MAQGALRAAAQRLFEQGKHPAEYSREAVGGFISGIVPGICVPGVVFPTGRAAEAVVFLQEQLQEPRLPGDLEGLGTFSFQESPLKCLAILPRHMSPKSGTDAEELQWPWSASVPAMLGGV